jgi:penicillin-binding protein 2
MFHRRLLLLAAAVVVSLVLLVGQLGRLTIVKGEELRAEAERRLVMWEWESTSRGRIVDRKGRVLAQDRPSFDVSVDYAVLDPEMRGSWARAEAWRAARLANRSRWSTLSSEEKEQLLRPYLPVFAAHVERMWETVAEVSGVERERLEERRLEVIRRVNQQAESVLTRRLDRELRARLAAGEEVTSETEEQILRRIDQRLQTQTSPHVILARVADGVGIEFHKLAERRVVIGVPRPDGSEVEREVPLLPGLTVRHSGDREYPFDVVSVALDRSSLPGPMASAERQQIAVEGVAYHVLGRVLEGVNADRKLGDGATLGHRERRRKRLAEDAAFAARVRTNEDISALPGALDRGHYQDSDMAGLGGVEETQEETLRGLRGLRVQELETKRTQRVEPEPGGDVHLTLDIMLQARVQAVMSADFGLAVAQAWHKSDNPTVPVGTPLYGAAVVLDIDSGEVLAMVSTPTTSREELRERSSAVFGDPWNTTVRFPWVDRTVGYPYPPGSIAKAIVLVNAVKEGKLNLDVPIDCAPGYLYPNRPDMYRCWIYKQYNTTHNARLGHAPLAPEALMVSCNIYFFTLGQRLGSEGIVRTYQMFGLGEPLELGVGPHTEAIGFLGIRAGGRAASADRPGAVSVQDAAQMGIGQGPVSWTPMHAADAYATLGRGGVRIRPRLIAGGTPEARDLGLSARAVKEALDGLSLSVNDGRGTGHYVQIEDGGQAERFKHFNVSGVQVWGKTGTAEAPKIRVNQDHPLWDIAAVDPDLPQGWRALRSGDHSWFVVLVGRAGEDRPRYAISVLMEYAGSGGKVSGPIVNQIIHALRSEGYL